MRSGSSICSSIERGHPGMDIGAGSSPARLKKIVLMYLILVYMCDTKIPVRTDKTFM